MNAVMYLIASTGVVMSPGKLAAQAAHAAVEAFRLSNTGTPGSREDQLYQAWYEGDHHTKIVLGADDLMVTSRYLDERGIRHHLVIDEGRTEFGGKLTPTCIGCALVDKDDPHVAATFSTFRLYRPPLPPAPSMPQAIPNNVVDLDAARETRRSRWLPRRSKTERFNYPQPGEPPFPFGPPRD